MKVFNQLPKTPDRVSCLMFFGDDVNPSELASVVDRDSLIALMRRSRIVTSAFSDQPDGTSDALFKQVAGRISTNNFVPVALGVTAMTSEGIPSMPNIDSGVPSRDNLLGKSSMLDFFKSITRDGSSNPQPRRTSPIPYAGAAMPSYIHRGYRRSGSGAYGGQYTQCQVFLNPLDDDGKPLNISRVTKTVWGNGSSTSYYTRCYLRLGAFDFSKDSLGLDLAYTPPSKYTNVYGGGTRYMRTVVSNTNSQLKNDVFAAVLDSDTQNFYGYHYLYDVLTQVEVLDASNCSTPIESEVAITWAVEFLDFGEGSNVVRYLEAGTDFDPVTVAIGGTPTSEENDARRSIKIKGAGQIQVNNAGNLPMVGSEVNPFGANLEFSVRATTATDAEIQAAFESSTATEGFLVDYITSLNAEHINLSLVQSNDLPNSGWDLSKWVFRASVRVATDLTLDEFCAKYKSIILDGRSGSIVLTLGKDTGYDINLTEQCFKNGYVSFKILRSLSL